MMAFAFEKKISTFAIPNAGSLIQFNQKLSEKSRINFLRR